MHFLKRLAAAAGVATALMLAVTGPAARADPGVMPEPPHGHIDGVIIVMEEPAHGSITGYINTPPRRGTKAASHGCPLGYVCVYPANSGWNNNRPSLRFYKYGAYNFVNQFGNHRVYNHQWGGASATLCLGYNGNRCTNHLAAGRVADVNLTPVNSIVLSPR